MRHHEYRGWTYDNEGWIYGYFCGCKNCIEHYKNINSDVIGQINGADGSFGNYGIVHLDEFTGLRDKNGNKVFENDIYHRYDMYGNFKDNYKVKFVDGAYRGRNLNSNCKGIKIWDNIAYHSEEIEVISNWYEENK